MINETTGFIINNIVFLLLFCLIIMSWGIKIIQKFHLEYMHLIENWTKHLILLKSLNCQLFSR